MIKYVFAALLVFGALQAYSLPEMVRHGYVNCTSCHVSPSGGGILTPYGKALSNEIVSTWNLKEEPEFDPSKRFRINVGGNLRAVQTYIDNPQVQEGRFILMQADIEVAASYLNRFYFVSTLGLDGKEVTDNKVHKGISRRHYFNYRPTEEWSIRAGRFLSAFGINNPNHTLTTRRGIGWGQDQETYNVEVAWLNEKFDVFLTGILGRPDKPELDREKGGSLSSSFLASDKYKLGSSLYYGSNNRGSRNLVGIWGILGFSERFFILAEIDHQAKQINSTSSYEKGAVAYSRVNYEFIQGFHVYFPYQVSYLNFDKAQSKADSYGIGVQLFPVNHIELNFEYLKQRIMSVANRYDDTAFLMFHGYF